MQHSANWMYTKSPILFIVPVSFIRSKLHVFVSSVCLPITSSLLVELINV